MSAQPAYAGRGFLASALARAEAWLLEPVDELETEPEQQRTLRQRPVVAVFGLAESCGATVIARGLGAELAARDPEGACVVSASSRSAALPIGSAAAGRLVRAIEALPAARAQASGRLCLAECGDLAALADAARYLAPLVLDAGRTAVGGVAASLADHVLLIASPRIEPALAEVARAGLSRVGPEPLIVVNRARGSDAFGDRADVLLPDSRMGAQFALAGREPRGELGRAIADLADRLTG